jgi:peptidoglycan-N-acetylmuramic acid deacetylase
MVPTAHADTVSPVLIHRFYNVVNGSHFYTASAAERDIVIARWPAVYTYEGIGYSFDAANSNNSAPLHRFYNVVNGSHFYTASATERDVVIARWPHVYTYEGVAYHVCANQAAGLSPVYRFYNVVNGSHFYTASAAERDAVRTRWPAVYTDEGIAFWVELFPVPAPADNTARGWWYIPNTTHTVPSVASGAVDLLATYGGRYIGPDPALVYLTIDQGYEIGNTPAILDALTRNDVHATFFVTESYVRNNPDLVRRMVAEGHVVGNHSATHPSMPTLADDPAAFASQFTRTEAAFTEVTGAQMASIFRPPAGEYSPLSLWMTQALGYESVFWSFAHRDWIVDDQPPVDVTIERILTGSHPGAIYLLHGVSSSDTLALDAAIAGLREQGYDFGVLGR